MSWTPVHPEWTAPAEAAIVDLHWLAYREVRQLQSVRAAGIAAAVAWVRGGRPGPVSERIEQPVTRALATAEMWAAAQASAPDIAAPPLESIARDLGVACVPPLQVDVEFADGAWRALRWLLGQPGQEPPLAIPVRGANGELVTAAVLMDAEIAADPWHFREPEQRMVLRRQVEAKVRRSLDLVSLIEQLQRELATG